MSGDIGLVETSGGAQAVQQTESQRGVGAGPRLQIGRRSGLGAQRIDHHDFAGRFRQPMFVSMGRGVGRVGAPHQDAVRIARRARIEALNRAAELQGPGHMSGRVTDAIGIDLGSAEMIEPTIGEHIPDQRQRARVMGVENGLGAVLRNHVVHARGDCR